MARLLISTALAGVLLSGAALAQPEDHRGPGGEPMTQDHRLDAKPAAKPAAAPAAKPAAAPAAKPAAPNQGGTRDIFDRRNYSGSAPAAAPAAPAARGNNPGRDFNRGNDNRAHVDNRPAPQAQPAPRNAMRGPSHNNFASYQRNFNAPHRFHASTYHRPSGWYAHRWTFGETLPSLFWASSYWINDFGNYGLMPPPAGTVWVRDGYDALLIDRFDGEIIEVAYDVFY